MTDWAVKPSLATLPPELIHTIFSYSHSLDVGLGSLTDLEQMAQLRSVSQTCRGLRELLLPLVWARVHVGTIKKLGMLGEILVATPRIALLIRSFRFAWDMDDDCNDWMLHVTGQRSTLDFAFCDRLALWNGLMQDPGAKIEVGYGYEKVRYNGTSCTPPGEEPDWEAVKKLGPAAYNWQAGRKGRGPDGNGEDRLIKNATQFRQCITEVTCMLTSLETFGWETNVTPMPRGVFDALTRLEALTDLRLVLSEYKHDLNELPFWEIAGQLRTLRINFRSEHFGSYSGGEDSVEETTESALTTTEGRISRLVEEVRTQEIYERLAERRYHTAIVCHTIVAAVTGGQLKRLEVAAKVLSPFAVRALLPYWLRIEDWGWWPQVNIQDNWQGAAKLLRPFFVHASRRQDWLEMPADATTPLDRRLTAQDLVTLQLYFQNGGELEHWWSDWYSDSQSHEIVFKLYLPWLVQDEELRQEVLATWNSIVERGEADKVKCRCNSCKLIYGESESDASNARSESSQQNAEAVDE